jgi:DNA-binding response OmpR family regulator
MAEILLLAADADSAAAAVPALEFLPHRVRLLGMDPGALLDLPAAELVIVDGRRDLQAARAATRLLQVASPDLPLLLAVTEGALTALSAEWGMRDFVLWDASPAEVEARIRLALAARVAAGGDSADEVIARGALRINPLAYTAKLAGHTLDLTYKEFELLRYLATYPGRVFTRVQLLQEVWGYDYYGGTRTVDVHVRRLRAKLGPEHDSLIGTVRNVGYRFDAPAERSRPGGRAGDNPATVPQDPVDQGRDLDDDVPPAQTSPSG